MRYTREHMYAMYEIIQEQSVGYYLAEDHERIIIGYEGTYITEDTHTYEALKEYYLDVQCRSHNHIYEGLFGVFGFEFANRCNLRMNVKKDKKNSSDMYFPEFLFIDAPNTILYNKINEEISFYTQKEIEYMDRLQYVCTYEIEKIYTKRSEEKQKQSTIVSNVTKDKEAFYKMVKKAKEYIAAGDIFQVVLAQSLYLETSKTSFSFYRELIQNNPSPYASHMHTPYGDIVGASPEALLERNQNTLRVMAIAGTSKRGQTEAQDTVLANALCCNEKECAEHKMLVDLARNDVSKVALPLTVRVTRLMEIDRFEHVMHLTSCVECETTTPNFECLEAVFPAGTLSGAPKIRALEIIEELESEERMFYGGGIGFLYANGNLQFAIVIRYAHFAPKIEGNNFQRVRLMSGAGIVFDSDPIAEYDEICFKRASLERILSDTSTREGAK